MQPLLTFLVATHDDERYITQCLESLLVQRPHGETEILVVDDASSDRTTAIVERFADGERCRLIRTDTNLGLGAACNLGLEHVRGRFVCRVDGDDYVDRDLAGTFARFLDQGGEADVVLAPCWAFEDGAPQNRRVLQPELDNVFTWMAGGQFLTRDLIAEVGGYRNVFWEEFDLYLRLLDRGARVAIMPVALLYHREHAASMTSNKENRMEGWRELAGLWGAERLLRAGGDPDLADVLGRRSPLAKDA
jgi:glycosyltransferase involved in cell wall biosynthesis